jgi:hypothetical protein
LNVPIPSYAWDFSNPECGEWGWWEWYSFHTFNTKKLSTPMTYESQ